MVLSESLTLWVLFTARALWAKWDNNRYTLIKLFKEKNRLNAEFGYEQKSKNFEKSRFKIHGETQKQQQDTTYNCNLLMSIFSYSNEWYICNVIDNNNKKKGCQNYTFNLYFVFLKPDGMYILKTQKQNAARANCPAAPTPRWRVKGNFKEKRSHTCARNTCTSQASPRHLAGWRAQVLTLPSLWPAGEESDSS